MNKYVILEKLLKRFFFLFFSFFLFLKTFWLRISGGFENKCFYFFFFNCCNKSRMEKLICADQKLYRNIFVLTIITVRIASIEQIV
jgi:hypothetical protein